MSAERAVPAAQAIAALTLLCACVLMAGCDTGVTVYYPAVVRSSPNGSAVALARVHLPCGGACWSLDLGPSMDAAETLQRLDAGQTCTEIAWTKDGSRVAFLIDGYQLRLYDAATRRPAGQINLLEPSGDPPARIARGVTFSDNSRAVTFDDCPRDRSGCRAGLVAVPVMDAAR